MKREDPLLSRIIRLAKVPCGIWIAAWIVKAGLSRKSASRGATKPGVGLGFFVFSNSCRRMVKPILDNLATLPEYRGNVVLYSTLDDCGWPDRKQTLWDFLEALRGFSEARVLFILNHQSVLAQHTPGPQVSKLLESLGIRTLCLQHGGTKTDSLDTLATTVSKDVLVWGEKAQNYIEQACRKASVHKNVFVTGNPAFSGNPVERKKRAAPSDKIVVLLATCSHAEYRSSEEHLSFFSDVYSLLGDERITLKIKKHPNDPYENSLYEALPEYEKFRKLGRLQLIESDREPGAERLQQLLQSSDVVVTRASTVAEDALLCGIPALAYDIQADGPSRTFIPLVESGLIKRVVNDRSVLLQSVLQLASTAQFNDRISLESISYSFDGKASERVICAMNREI